MSIFNAPARPLGPPPVHVLPLPGCIVYSDDGRRLWCTPGQLVIEKPDGFEVEPVPLTLISWAANAAEGWAYVEVSTDSDGVVTMISPTAGDVLPAHTRYRPAGTLSPMDPGSGGTYNVPLARLFPGVIQPIFAGSAALRLYLAPP